MGKYGIRIELSRDELESLSPRLARAKLIVGMDEVYDLFSKNYPHGIPEGSVLSVRIDAIVHPATMAPDDPPKA